MHKRLTPDTSKLKRVLPIVIPALGISAIFFPVLFYYISRQVEDPLSLYIAMVIVPVADVILIMVLRWRIEKTIREKRREYLEITDKGLQHFSSKGNKRFKKDEITGYAKITDSDYGSSYIEITHVNGDSIKLYYYNMKEVIEALSNIGIKKIQIPFNVHKLFKQTISKF